MRTAINVIELGISVIISCTLLFAIVTSFNITGNISESVQKDIDTRVALEETLEFDKYNNADVHGTEVLSAVLNYRDSDIGVYIKDKNIYYNKALVSGEYTSGAIVDDESYSYDNLEVNIDVTGKYTAEIKYHKNGFIAQIEFTKI